MALTGVLVFAASASYVVEPGDTLGSIARDNGTTIAAILELNDIANPNLIRVGQVITLPGQDGQSSTTHVVSLGETLSLIASSYGSSVRSIVDANSISNANLIRVGQKLVIPGATSTTSDEDSGEAQGGGGPATTGTINTTHIVSAGETLAAIAARYGVTVDDIIAANGLLDDRIYIGNTLVITDSPSSTGPVTTNAPAETGIYTVVAGDTLGRIASLFDTTISTLVSMNGLSNPNSLRIDQELKVPLAASVSWVCPVPGARYFNDWGFPRSGGRYHQGNDLFAARGTEVRAPVSGTARLINGTIGGLQFWLDGDDGNLYIGTHLDAFGKGGPVNAGDVVGYVGDSGNAVGSSPHLHFEIHVDGSPTNPYPTLRANDC